MQNSLSFQSKSDGIVGSAIVGLRYSSINYVDSPSLDHLHSRLWLLELADDLVGLHVAFGKNSLTNGLRAAACREITVLQAIWTQGWMPPSFDLVRYRINLVIICMFRLGLRHLPPKFMHVTVGYLHQRLLFESRQCTIAIWDNLRTQWILECICTRWLKRECRLRAR